MGKKMACAAAVLAAGVVTVAVDAPTAAAQTKSCWQPSPYVTQCSTPGSASLNARPNPMTAPNTYGNGYMQNFLIYGSR